MSQFYKQKRDVFERYMKEHLDGLAQWDTPEAGMFFWFVPLRDNCLIERSSESVHHSRFKLLLKEPGLEGEEEDSESLIRGKALEKGVLALPGTVFLPDGGKTPYVRAAFSLLDEADVEEAIKRLRAVVLETRGA